MPRRNTGTLTPAQLKRREREAASLQRTIGFQQTSKLALSNYSPSYLQKKVTALTKELSESERAIFKREAARLGMTKQDMADYLTLRKQAEDTRVKVEDAILEGRYAVPQMVKDQVYARRDAARRAKAGVSPSLFGGMSYIAGVPLTPKIGDLKLMPDKTALAKEIDTNIAPASTGIAGWAEHSAEAIRRRLKQHADEYGINTNLDWALNHATPQQLLELDRNGEIRNMLYNDNSNPDDGDGFISQVYDIAQRTIDAPNDFDEGNMDDELGEILEQNWTLKLTLAREFEFDPWGREMQSPDAFQHLRKKGLTLQRFSDAVQDDEDAYERAQDIQARHSRSKGEYASVGNREYGVNYDRYDSGVEWHKGKKGEWNTKTKRR